MSKPNILAISEQENAPGSNTNPSNELDNQQMRIVYKPKRVKQAGADDSFEREHRVVNSSIQYFNRGDSRTTSIATTAPGKPNETNSTLRRPNFPPFRLNFIDDDKPSELSIIKSMNKHFKINITYGRYTNITKKSFSVFVNTGEQFDQLMDRNAWPDLICEIDYSIDLPSKVPASYSIVVLGVPTKWNLADFEVDLKNQYKSIVKVERLLVRGGVPIPKVCIDFSNNEDVTRILKDKKLLFDDENTSFQVQPYSPPVKILRCFNCQMYNDHIASNCPKKNNPICFRCGEDHAYDPKCSNKISCANCKQEHMAGNPNCPFKIEARKKLLDNKLAQSSVKPKPIQILKQSSSRFPPPPSVWFNSNKPMPDPHDGQDDQPNETFVDIRPPDLLSLNNKLDLLMRKIDVLVDVQAATNSNINSLNQQIISCQDNLASMKQFILNSLCPYVAELSESLLTKNTTQRKEKLHAFSTQLKQNIQSFVSGTSLDINLVNMLPNSSPNESNS